jgi:TolB-like protein/DNA-binding winged helix-turn-helix (wHTH) protein/tetratricopeptide (TPR) repeat protein
LAYPLEVLADGLGAVRHPDKGRWNLPYYFEDQVLDPGRRELSRRGETIPLEPKVFDLLVYLIENRDRLVTKDDLIAKVWAGRIVSDSALTSAINAARTAIGDNGREQRLLRTSSRKGIRFVCPVRLNPRPGHSDDEDAESPKVSETHVQANGSSVAVAGAQNGVTIDVAGPTSAPPLSMVVLPFANLSSDSGQEYFVDAIVECLTTDLSRIRQSFVIARNTAFTYKNKAVDAKQIGKDLGVRYLIEGSIQCAATRLRVTVQLIDTTTGSHLWAERFDRDRGDLLEIQDEIVTSLARMLDVELIAAESKRAALSANPHSLEITFRGWAAFNRGINPDRLKEARGFFEEALALDQNNVMALTGLSDTNSAMIVGYMTDDPAGYLAATEAMAMKACTIAPDDAKAHASLALVYLWTNRVSQSISEYEHALNLDQNLAFAYANIGIAKYVSGRPQETEAHIVRAIGLSPRDTQLNAWYTAAGVAKLALCRDEEAVVRLRRGIEANRNLPLTHFILASALALQGKINDGLAATKAGLALDPKFTIQRFRNNPLSDNPSYLANRSRICEGMFAAGVPKNS